MDNQISVRKLVDEDVPMFKKWLYVPHVAKWYHEPLDWIYEVENREKEFHWINHFIVECNGNPIGFCQYYEFKNSGETWHGNVELEGTYSIDYLIGEQDYLKKGYGKEIISWLVDAISHIPNAKRIIVQPENENLASCNTLLTNQFSYDTTNEIFIKII